jgi:predicted tellurium resistance membrane protein TerC
MDTFTLENIFTLVMLVMLQAVLGIDNLLYISLESKNAPVEKQGFVRKVGIGVAIILRIALLFLLVSVIGYFQSPFIHINLEGIITGEFNLHSIIVFLGGGFIIYTAIKEIWHLIAMEKEKKNKNEKKKSIGKIIFVIVIMNLVFSFDSILSAMALTDVFWLMTVAIIIGGIIMIWLSEKVSKFLQKNRMYEVLGLFILFLVGIMLLTEGGHLSHLKILSEEITPMNKTTFYFILAILVIIDIVQSKYQKKLIRLSKTNNEENN